MAPALEMHDLAVRSTSNDGRLDANDEDDGVFVVRNSARARNLGVQMARPPSPSPELGTEPERFEGRAAMVPVPRQSHLGYFSTYALVLNKTIGTGIYTSPAVVLAAVGGAKGVSLMFWLAGCIVTCAGLYMYLEYGFRWPVTGGELYYIDNVWTRPVRLFTYMFASIFILVNGVQSNALTFGREIVYATQGPDGPEWLQKLIAVISITFVCQLLAYSRSIYIRLSNMIAVYKLLLLLFITIAGFVALGGARVENGQEIQSTYGKDNFADAFQSAHEDLNAYSLALLNVMRAFLGYENANLVLHEVRTGPRRDERRVFRRAVTAAVFSICTLYVLVNIAFFAACTSEELAQNSTETLAFFLQKVFGKSERARTASSVFICLSAMGAMLSLTFANVRVKQEIARLGLVPVGEFWAETSHRRTPAHALLLNWIFSVICIVITPLDNADGFLIMSTFYAYVHTYISVLLGLALLAAPYLASFDLDGGQRFHPRATPFGYWMLGPLLVIYVLANAFVLAFSFVPGPIDPLPVAPGRSTLPYYTAPVAGVAVIAFGVLWWLCDRHLMPRLGYEFWVKEHTEFQEQWGVDVLLVQFHRDLSDPAAWVYEKCGPAVRILWRLIVPSE